MARRSKSWMQKMPPVYHRARLLLLQYQASTAKAPRAIKYGMVADAIGLIMEVMVNIAFADQEIAGSRERRAFIDEARRIMRRVCVVARVVSDAGGMKPSGFHAVCDLEADVMRQLDLWKLSETHNNKDDNPGAK